MDTPPPIEPPFVEESVIERIIGLNEMFPERLRSAVCATVSNSASCIKWAFSATRTVTWILTTTAAILILPISLESERTQYEQQMKRHERGIMLGSEGSQPI